MAMCLRDGLRAERSSRIAFAGAGGKTTAMFTLARQLTEPVICLNTAHLAVEQAQLADHHIFSDSDDTIRDVFRAFRKGMLLFTGQEEKPGRLSGVPASTALKIKDLADLYNVPILVEADGARMLPLKAPAAHEPPIPDWVEHVVYLVGLSVIGKPLTDEHVFRAEIFSELTGVEPGKPIELAAVVKYANNPLGGLKNIPAGARRTLFANQLDACSLPREEVFRTLHTASTAYDSVLAGSLLQPDEEIEWRREGIAGIVLAAGGSKRMGRVKQLLAWKGKPLVRHVAETAIAAGLDPVVVVTGCATEQVERALVGLPVKVIFNPEWERGQASSIRAGLDVLPGQRGGAVFLLSDMPQVPPALIEAELEIHQREAVSIICPRVGVQRTNPVLFDRQTFPALHALTGDSGGRALFDRVPIRWLDWDDPDLLRDIDTPEDYREFIKGDENG